MRLTNVILERAIEILETKGWCQNSSAKDSKGYAVDWDSPFATCFCLTGAVYRATKDLGLRLHYSDDVFIRLYHLNNFNSLADFNDGSNRRREEVISLLNLIS